MMKTEQKIAPAALRRGIAFLCTLVLTLLAVTLPAEAAVNVEGSFNVPNIRLSDSGYKNGTQPSKYKELKNKGGYSWSAADTKITGTVTPAEWKRYLHYCCETGASSTLKITNTSQDESLLKFSYTPVSHDGKLTFGHNGETNDGDPIGGTYSAILAPNEFVTVTLTTSAKTESDFDSTQQNYTTTATLSDIELISMNTNISVTFVTAEGGIYYAETADGGKLPMDATYTKPRNTEYKFTAVPNPDYSFIGWYVDGQRRSSGSTFTTVFTENCTVVARFFRKGAAVFETGGQIFDDLNKAVETAQNTQSSIITLESSGTITGNYAIPAGITLLIPFDEDKTLYTNKPESVAGYTKPSVFRKMTMASGSSIAVDGAISVGGMHCHTMGNLGPSGPYGQIDMAADSAITLNSGANLYAWGFITGDGQITATPGATVYEYFQVMDWRGGTATSGMILNPSNHVFPFSQYYVQNIEAALTIQTGAQEQTYISIEANDKITSTSIDFIGSNKSLFRLGNEGTLTKKYDPSTDRVTYTTTGSASLDSLALSVPGYNIDSKNYVLPVNSNMTLEILSGRVAVNSDAALLPGAKITIAQGAELNVTSGVSLYVYDIAEWGNYCYNNVQFAPVKYSPTKTWTRTLTDATIDVNGTLTAAGSIYTTVSGANIPSTKETGRFIQTGGPGTESKTHQVKKQGTIPLIDNAEYADIPITPAQLLNADGSYTLTAGSSARDTFTYCTGSECGGGKWVKNLQVAAINNNDGTQVTTHETLQEAVDRFSQDSSGNTYIKMLHSTTEEINAQSDLYLDLNGCTVTGNFNMTGHTLYGMDSATDEYNGVKKAGKIVGSVAPYAKTTYQTPPVPENVDDGAYKRYVAISGKEADGKANLSFHRFNISVTGYRFELAAPECALFFIGKFQGEAEAKKHLTSLGFTLKDGKDTQLGTDSYSLPANPEDIPKESNPGKSPVVLSGDAYLFEVHLKRSFEKNSDVTASEEFSAIAKATFKSSGVQDQDEDNSLSSVERNLSFKKAWEDALKPTNSGMKPKDKEILTNFLKKFGINIKVE